MEKAQKCLSAVKVAKSNISFFERIYEVGKDEIAICTKERLDGGHGNVNPIYISGEGLEVVKNAYIKHWQDYADRNQAEFEAL